MKIKILVVGLIFFLLFNLISVNTFGLSDLWSRLDQIKKEKSIETNKTIRPNIFRINSQYFTEKIGKFRNENVRLYTQGIDV